jgi:hypothetical protein
LHVNRRQSSLSWNMPVTPEVAGSSPVAPVSRSACNRHLRLPDKTRLHALWPNPVAQRRSVKCLQTPSNSVTGRTNQTGSRGGHQMQVEPRLPSGARSRDAATFRREHAGACRPPVLGTPCRALACLHLRVQLLAGARHLVRGAVHEEEARDALRNALS